MATGLTIPFACGVSFDQRPSVVLAGGAIEIGWSSHKASDGFGVAFQSRHRWSLFFLPGMVERRVMGWGPDGTGFDEPVRYWFCPFWVLAVAAWLLLAILGRTRESRRHRARREVAPGPGTERTDP